MGLKRVQRLDQPSGIGPEDSIDSRNTMLERVRIALSFYRRDMQTTAEKAGIIRRDYPYGIEVENEVRRILGEPLLDGGTSPWPMLGEPKPETVKS